MMLKKKNVSILIVELIRNIRAITFFRDDKFSAIFAERVFAAVKKRPCSAINTLRQLARLLGKFEGRERSWLQRKRERQLLEEE